MIFYDINRSAIILDLLRSGEYLVEAFKYLRSFQKHHPAAHVLPAFKTYNTALDVFLP